ncbi:transient receptor potential cation channel subfamily A member 1 [Clonorchis sinensis]|uniref:Transient receptor potential cation channel subfamily A member 1 n=1 Tax=Clonorchis sinensis TaxID=79923 RepID=G7YA99_CLOSI|nr:transient receptor potential cation channel subfamily A member 1 [Clonorchis sinensis]
MDKGAQLYMTPSLGFPLRPSPEDHESEQSGSNIDSRRSSIGELHAPLPEELQFLKIRDYLSHVLQQFHKELTQRARYEEGVNSAADKSVKFRERHSIRHKYAFVHDPLQQNDVARAFQCVAMGHSGDLFDMLFEYPDLLKAQDSSGSSLLHCSIEKGRPELVNLLLSRGADVNALDALGNTPVHLAVRACRVDILNLLISNGARLTTSNRDGLQPVHLASELAFVAGLKRLLDYKDVEVDALDERGSTPLYHCFMLDSDECVRILLDRGTNIYHKNAFGSSVLHEAILQHAVKCVHLLFEHEIVKCLQDGLKRTKKLSSTLTAVEPVDQKKSTSLLSRIGDWIGVGVPSSRRSSTLSTSSEPTSTSSLINLVDDEGFSPIHIAVNTGNMELIKACLDRGANVLAQDLAGQTPLHYACTRGDLDCAKALLEHNPKYKARMISTVNRDGRGPIHLAAMYDHPNLIDYLLSQGAELNARDNKSMTPLLLAGSKGSVEASKHLVNIGAELTCCDENGRNLAILLLFSGAGAARDIIPDLMETGQLPVLFNQPDRWGCTFMHISARLGLRVAMRIGAQFGGHILAKDSEHSTPLHSAARFGRIQICQYMLEMNEGKRALFLADDKGRLPLHLAAQYGNNRVVEFLLANGCLYRRCHEGNTPLHYAAMKGNADTCALLLAMNPSILNEVNYTGSTALHFAAMHANADVINYLLTAGADVIPDHNGLYFTSLAFQPGSYFASRTIALHKRFPEIAAKLWNTDQCPIEKMIRNAPSILLTKYDFTVLQAPPRVTDKRPVAPMKLVKLMVKLKREELLIHPLCTAYLDVKWNTYGRWIQFLVTLYYLSLSISITWLALRQMPLSVNYDNPQTSQCMDKRWEYFKEWTNCLLTIFQILVGLSAMLNLLEYRTPHGAALTLIVMFISWFNLLLQLLRFQSIGIFVIMFLQVSTTIMKSASVLSMLFFAFAVTFHKLLTLPEEQEFDESPQFLKNRLAFCFLGFQHLNQSTTDRPDADLSMKVYANMGLALFQTLMMMVGEYEHTDVITKPYLDSQASTIYIPELTFPFFALFVFLVPISLMNLMIGLAVGDIDNVRRSATQQLIAQQVYWLETLEARCPMWLYRRIYVPFWIRRTATTIKKRDPHQHEVKRDMEKLLELSISCLVKPNLRRVQESVESSNGWSGSTKSYTCYLGLETTVTIVSYDTNI